MSCTQYCNVLCPCCFNTLKTLNELIHFINFVLRLITCLKLLTSSDLSGQRAPTRAILRGGEHAHMRDKNYMGETICGGGSVNGKRSGPLYNIPKLGLDFQFLCVKDFKFYIRDRLFKPIQSELSGSSL